MPLRARVGWVERSETHRLRIPALMGIASLHPSYEICPTITVRMRDARPQLCNFAAPKPAEPSSPEGVIFASGIMFAAV
jgi:hypothetical protein